MKFIDYQEAYEESQQDYYKRKNSADKIFTKLLDQDRYKKGIRIFRQINNKYIVCGLLLVLLIPIYIVENVYNFIIFVISKRTLLWWFITNFCISLFFSFVTVYIDVGYSKEFSLFNSIFIIIVLPLGINLLFNRK